MTSDVRTTFTLISHVVFVLSTGSWSARALAVLRLFDMSAEDIITYNTLLKGYCQKGDIKGAKDRTEPNFIYLYVFSATVLFTRFRRKARS